MSVAAVGAWCWFADPRAVSYNGDAVFGWVSDDGSVMVGDNRGRSFALHPQLQRDDHNNPAFHVRRDGRLAAFWTAHSGDALYYRITEGSDISAWGATHTGPPNPAGVPGQYTYANPVPSGDALYLFWSGVANTATWSRSHDDGTTWEAARPLFDPSRWPVRYIKYAAGADGAIHMAWTLVHPRWVESAVYHAVLRDGVVRRMDGTRIGALGQPLDPFAGDVVSSPSTDGGAWIHDLEVVSGRPVLAYATFPTRENHAYRYASWNGSAWVDEHVTMAGPSFNPDPVHRENEYSGGVSIDSERPHVLWLSRKVAGQFEVERWIRTRVGWAGEALTHGSSSLNVRPYPVAGGVAWMRGRYDSFTSFLTSIAWAPAPALPVEPTAVPAPPQAPEPEPAPAPEPGGIASPSVDVAPEPGGVTASGQPPALRPVTPQTPDRPPRAACGRHLRRWAATRNRVHLQRTWTCRTKAGQCRRALTTWRTTGSRFALAAFRAHCGAPGSSQPNSSRATAR
jgi:hypothetical protein